MRLREAFSSWGDIWIRSGWRVQMHCTTARCRLRNSAGRLVAAGSADECIEQGKNLAPTAGARQAAVLLHGLWDDPGIMSPLARALEGQGWAVANLGYPSLRLPLAAHGAAASRAARALMEDGAEEVAFVGHSLGGLVARTAMADGAISGRQAGRLVLIGSPAYGSAIAGFCNNIPGYGIVTGACASYVTPAGAVAIPPPAASQVLVIAGGTGGRGFNPLLRGDNDGLITVAETRMPGHETSFRLVRSTHRDLPMLPGTIAACTDFLTAGPKGCV